MGRRGRIGRWALALVLALLVVALASQVVSAGCGGWGSVTNVTPYPSGNASWVAIHVAGGGYPNGYFTSFPTARSFVVGGSAYVYGCPDAARYVTGPLVWR